MLQHLSRAHTFLSPRPRFTTFTSTGVDYTYELHREISPPRNGVINAPTLLLPSLDTFALYFSLLFSSPSFFLSILSVDDGKTAPYGKIPKNTWYFFPILLEIRVVAARF